MVNVVNLDFPTDKVLSNLSDAEHFIETLYHGRVKLDSDVKISNFIYLAELLRLNITFEEDEAIENIKKEEEKQLDEQLIDLDNYLDDNISEICQAELIEDLDIDVKSKEIFPALNKDQESKVNITFQDEGKDTEDRENLQTPDSGINITKHTNDTINFNEQISRQFSAGY